MLFQVDRRPIFVLGFTGSDKHPRGFWGDWASDDDSHAIDWLEDALDEAIMVFRYRRVLLHLMAGLVQGVHYPAVLCGDPWFARRLPRVVEVLGNPTWRNLNVEFGIFTAWKRGSDPRRLEVTNEGRRAPSLGNDSDCLFRAINEAPLLRAGCRMICKDLSSGDPADVLNHAQEASAYGVKVIGEAVPHVAVSGALEPHVHYIERMSWMAFANWYHTQTSPTEQWPGVDPMRRWRVDPMKSEVHCIFRPNDRGPAEATQENISDYRGRGFVVGGHSGLTAAAHRHIVLGTPKVEST